MSASDDDLAFKKELQQDRPQSTILCKISKKTVPTEGGNNSSSLLPKAKTHCKVQTGYDGTRGRDAISYKDNQACPERSLVAFRMTGRANGGWNY